MFVIEKNKKIITKFPYYVVRVENATNGNKKMKVAKKSQIYL